MKHKTNILPLLLLVSISLLACIIAFMARGGEVDVMTVLQYFVWNLPICLLVGFIDYKIITWSHRWRIPSDIWSILLDILVSNILLSLLSIVYIYAEASLRGIEVQFMQRIILSVFCNSAIILISKYSITISSIWRTRRSLLLWRKKKRNTSSRR